MSMRSESGVVRSKLKTILLSRINSMVCGNDASVSFTRNHASVQEKSSTIRSMVRTYGGGGTGSVGFLQARKATELMKIAMNTMEVYRIFDLTGSYWGDFLDVLSDDERRFAGTYLT